MWTDELSRSDMRLIRKAIANGWKVPPATRQRIVTGLMDVIKNDSNVRKILASARTIVAAVADNIRHEQASREQVWPTDG